MLYYFSGPDGYMPEDFSAYGGHLYGNTQYGGTNNRGVIYQYDPPNRVIPIYEF